MLFSLFKYLAFYIHIAVAIVERADIDINRRMIGEPTNSYRVPTVRIEPNSDVVYNFKEYDDVVVICVATGHPMPSIRWTIFGGELERRNLNLRSSTLRIPNITRDENCRVSCRASNGIGNPAITSKRINVLYLDRPVLTAHLTNKWRMPSTSIWFENTVYLHCTVTSNPAAVFTWLLNGTVIRPNEQNGLLVQRIDAYSKDTSTVILKIKDAQEKDFGDYRCQTSVVGFTSKYLISDTVANFTYSPLIAPPRIGRITPKLIKVNPGGKVRIQCDIISGFPEPKIDWVTETGVFSERIVISKMRNILTIDGAMPQDSGNYYCTANNQVGTKVEKRTTVVVRDIGPMTYWLTPDPLRDDRSFAVATDIKLTCHVDAAPYSELQYAWFKKNSGGERVRITERNSRDNIFIRFLNSEEKKRGITFPAKSSQLQIRRLTEDDYGTYVCSGKLPTLGPNGAESFAVITVSRESAPAKIEAIESRVVVTEGDPASLKCRTIGKPKPLVIWFRNENTTMPSGNMQEVTSGGVLVINRTSREDADLYTCAPALYNGFSKHSRSQSDAVVELQVQYKPTVEPSYREIRRPLGSDVTLSCFVSDASPMIPITYVWKKENVVQTSSSSGQHLVLQSIQVRDCGVYICEVTNAIGKARCALNVTAFAFKPEFLFTDVGEGEGDLTSTVFPQTKSDPGTFMYLLSWTQKHPNAVDAVTEYRIRWRLTEKSFAKNRGMSSNLSVIPNAWIEDTMPANGILSYGQLLTYQISDLVKGVYQVEVTPKTIFGYGDSNTREIYVRERRSQRETSPTLSLDPSFFCQFNENDLCGFIQEKNPNMDTIDWTKNSARTQLRRTKNTGPSADHSTLTKEAGGYMYIEASLTTKGDRARLISPIIFDKSSSRQCLKFWYHMRGRHIGILRVMTKKRGENETEIWRVSGDQGDKWNTGDITIQHTVPYQIIFEAVITYVDGYQGDIAIDDVLLADGKCIVLPTTTPYYVSTTSGSIGSSSFNYLFVYLKYTATILIVFHLFSL
uniref:MAM domain-containing glycosylphosphatidylinositol anchor protein 2-like isoform X1 n=1 Tax=Ciona intestinalis TaxID=7719 RepID=UPI000EF44698|nr:MAM domain-containing glycosylphosphatidylinositol anchor protein 2-like isoform X1 [Ciona intestinalis]|eukprot:XP_018673408.2 MAM domain-containing glycosylphosphatidylinositol anchor protein 2-like isoform X1 [Ciona intestinalis]